MRNLRPGRGLVSTRRTTPSNLARVGPTPGSVPTGASGCSLAGPRDPVEGGGVGLGGFAGSAGGMGADCKPAAGFDFGAVALDGSRVGSTEGLGPAGGSPTA